MVYKQKQDYKRCNPVPHYAHTIGSVLRFREKLKTLFNHHNVEHILCLYLRLKKIFYQLTPCVTILMKYCKSVYLKVAYINIMFTIKYKDDGNSL